MLSVSYRPTLRETLRLRGDTNFDLALTERLLDVIEMRLRPVEDKKASLEAVEKLIRDVGLQRINDVLTPAIQSVLLIQERGFLMARSSTSATIAANDVHTFVIEDEHERATFVPGPYPALTRQGAPDDTAVTRLIDWRKETGELMVEIIAVFGDPGPHDDWVIVATAGVANAMQAMLDEMRLLADQVAGDKLIVDGYRDEAQGARDAAITARNQASGFAGDAQDARDAAIEARNDAQSAAASLVSVVVLKGEWDASGGTFPGGSGVTAGDSWIVTAAGLVDGVDFNIGDRLIALIAEPSTSAYASNWFHADYTDKVSSVAGRAGNVVLLATDIAETSNRKWLTEAQQVAVESLAPFVERSAKDIVRLALSVAELRGTAQGLSSGVADAFEDATGVDAGASTNELAGDGFYTNHSSAIEGVQSLPAMTGASAPAGHVATASVLSVSAWTAFAQDGFSGSWSGGGAPPQWIQRQTPVAIIAAGYRVQATGAPLPTATAWTLQGSNNGSSWTTLDTQSGLSWSAGEVKTFDVAPGSRGAYTYHRLNCTASGNGTNTAIAELELLQEIGSLAMDLRSVGYTALSAPDKATITVAAKAVGGTIVPGTHLVAYTSRDGGTTWTAGTLTAAETLADGTTIYETGEIDISGQPSGTAMKWRIVTGDAFEVQVHGVSMLWR